MATTLQSQLLAIKSFVQGETEQRKRPFTRPSLIFDPKEAADIDLETILTIALSGLEALIERDHRFGNYQNTLFSQKSRELDREMMSVEENKNINVSISSYLRLLAGYLDLPSALKTLEYLIRRYKVHVYNIDELVLCALPYHDTHAFVRIVQLLDLGNKKWEFLEGVKTSGATPPRKVIVQHCIRNMGVLEALCNYALPVKKFQPSRPVICFCTAVVVEALGCVPSIDGDTVMRILPFVFSGLNPEMDGGSDHKAGAMMIVGILATRATLASKLVQKLVFFIARIAQLDAKQSADLPWLRLSLMAIISLVQLQSIQMFPKKALDVLKEIRDLAGVLMVLSQEFNIGKFLSVYLEALADYSSSDDSCRLALITTIETVHVKDFVDNIVVKVLTACMKLSQRTEKSELYDSGSWAKQILVVIDKYYPSELRLAVRKFLEDPNIYSKQEDSIFETLSLMFDGRLDVPIEISHAKVWFSLEHPKAEVRLATLSGLAASDMLKSKSIDPQLTTVQEAILRRLHDNDLSVVQAALSLVGMPGIINHTYLLKSLQDVILRCVDIPLTSTCISSQACDVAISCLECAVRNSPKDQLGYSKEVAAMVFPLLLILPKTWNLNFKALELVKEIHWPFYGSIWNGEEHLSTMCAKKVKPSRVTSFNMKTVGALAENFLAHPEEYMPWLIECCNTFQLSKTLFFMIILQSFMIKKEEIESLLVLCQACFPVLKNEVHELESRGDRVLSGQLNIEKLDKACTRVIDDLLDSNLESLNSNILICIYWSLLKACATMALKDSSANNREWLSLLEDLFIFSAASPLKHVFLEYLLVVVKSNTSPIQFLSKFFTEEGYSVPVHVESLCSFATICSSFASLTKGGLSTCSHMQLLLTFPSLLIPLSNHNQDIRMAAMDCIEGLYNLMHHVDISSVKNGSECVVVRNICTPDFGDFLGLMLHEKNLISSDVNFLPSYLTSVLGSSSHSLLVPQNIHKRLEQHTKEAMLHFILSTSVNFSAYGKLMVLALLKGIGNAIINLEEVKLLLFELLNRRSQYHFGHDRSFEKLSRIEIETLCLLLESCASFPSSSPTGDVIVDYLSKALQVDNALSEDPAVIQPCVTVLQNLTCPFYDNLKTEVQDELVQDLLILFRNDNGAIQNAAREALLQINVSCFTVSRLLDLILAQEGWRIGSLNKTKRKKPTKSQRFGLRNCLFSKGEGTLSFLCSLLDFLLLKKDMKSRDCLIEPLFRLLGFFFKGDWVLALVNQDEQQTENSSDIAETVSGLVAYIQQTILLILEDICASLLSDLHVKDDILNKINVNLLVECARTTKDVMTRNYVLLLLTSVAKVIPDRVLEHVIDIFTVIGESAITQSDSHSQRVFEGLISTIIPFWLSTTENTEKLLQIFIDVFPEVSEHRRLTLMVYLLRTLGEKCSLGSLLVLLFRSLVLRTSRLSSDGNMYASASLGSGTHREWEYRFAVQVCEQYSCTIWLPSLVMLLQEIGIGNQRQEQIAELLVAMQFTLQKLIDTELVFKLDSPQDVDDLQRILGALMEQVVSHLQLVVVRSKQLSVPTSVRKELKECIHTVLKTISNVMVPSAYFKAITLLLGHADGNVRKKALGLLCETVKNSNMSQKKHKERRKLNENSPILGFHMGESDWESFNGMSLEIVKLVDGYVDDLDEAVTLAAISALDVLANVFSSNNLIFTTCLTSVAKHIGSNNLAISSCCLRTTGALINALGPRALSELPLIMENLLKRTHDVRKFKHTNDRALSGLSSLKESLLLSVLHTLEAVLDKFGSFLNPYLENIIELMVLYPEYATESDLKMKLKADTVRRFITEKIPVRLILTPLLKIYPDAVKCGESSLSVAFEMLASTISTMDRSAVGSYHTKIFQQCLLALDLRRQHPVSVQNIEFVEQSVIRAIIVLTMKLTETMFKPLFIRTVEWAESEVEENGPSKSKSLDRIISFYKLINKLAEQHRSLFVPYYKYLLEGCTRYLTEDEDPHSTGHTQKRKKAKVQDMNHNTEAKGLLSPRQWHLRAIVLSSLNKCFLYDTGSLKFLDSSNFQVLLRPIVSQLVAEPPASLELLPNVPTVKEVDDTLVSCLGQMAVTSGSDLLWKPLNHEVLMQTRSEKLRSRILGLRVVKYLVEHLKEEYLVLLPETIPFLGELLEDIELPVKSLAQEILKEMESLSGESLRQYL
ncbi:ARM repeat superfamily protein isoform X2 [Tasmannia lanceolata]|uniref:ARM repeat superfamily protein isoform X2 n=1 Tax=Tasmannia lanceolata TaxID=3420 RepID=UPI0040628ECF